MEFCVKNRIFENPVLFNLSFCPLVFRPTCNPNPELKTLLKSPPSSLPPLRWWIRLVSDEVSIDFFPVRDWCTHCTSTFITPADPLTSSPFSFSLFLSCFFLPLMLSFAIRLLLQNSLSFLSGPCACALNIIDIFLPHFLSLFSSLSTYLSKPTIFSFLHLFLPRFSLFLWFFHRCPCRCVGWNAIRLFLPQCLVLSFL